jgi:hypothetical protein
MDELFARLHRVFDMEVEQRLSGQTQNNGFLDLLLNAKVDDDGVVGLDRDTLRSMFVVSISTGITDCCNCIPGFGRQEMLVSFPFLCDSIHTTTQIESHYNLSLRVFLSIKKCDLEDKNLR